MKFMKILLTFTFLAGATSALAQDVSQQKTTCYTFNQKSNKPTSQGKCTVDGGMGAGGYWVNINFNKKEYSFEYLHDEESSDDYIRHAKTFKKIKESEVKKNTPILLCKKNKPRDICYKD